MERPQGPSFEELRDKLLARERECEILRADLRRLKEAAAELRERYARLSQRAREAETALPARDEVVEQLKSRIEDLAHRLMAKGEEVLTLRERTEEAEATAQAARNESADLMRQRDELWEKVMLLERERDERAEASREADVDTEKKMESIQGEVVRLRERSEQLSASRETLQGKIADQVSEAESIRSVNNQLIKRCDELQRDVSQALTELAHREEELEVRDAREKQLKQQIGELSEWRAKAEEERHAKELARQEIEGLKRRMDRLQARLVEAQSWREQWEDMDIRCLALKEELAQSRSAVNELQVYLAKMTYSIGERDGRIAGAEEALKDARNTLMKRERELANLTTRLGLLGADNPRRKA